MRYYADDYARWHDRRVHEMNRFRGFGLRYWVLSILANEPSTGAMIMGKVEDMSMGRWRPSPGHIYPLLEQLSDEGYLSVDNREGRKYYSLTEKGRSILEESWFPWRTMGGLASFHGLEDAIRNIETLTEYISDNRDKIKSNTDIKKRIDRVIERLNAI